MQHAHAQAILGQQQQFADSLVDEEA